jgi:hypothetical protein
MIAKRAYLVLVANGGASAVAVDEDKIEAAEACTSGYVAIEVASSEYRAASDALARIMPEPNEGDCPNAS